MSKKKIWILFKLKSDLRILTIKHIYKKSGHKNLVITGNTHVSESYLFIEANYYIFL